MIARTPTTVRDAVEKDPHATAVGPASASPPVSIAPRGRGRPKTRRKTADADSASPGKPYKSFPLTPHKNGQFCKKIRGKLHYFGTIKDPEAALRLYREQCAGLHSGRVAEVKREGELTVGELANRFLEVAEVRRDGGEIEPRTFVDYYRECERLVRFFGKGRSVETITREDLRDLRRHLARGIKPDTLNGRIGMTRSIFRFAYDEELIDRPIRFSRDLKRPDQRTLRRSRAEAGRKHFLANEIRVLLDAAPLQIKAMILLGINCALGNRDVAELPIACIDIEHGWLDYPRGKTGIQRRCPLWPETIAAIVAVMDARKKSQKQIVAEAGGLLFVTRKGKVFVRSHAKKSPDGRPQVVEHDALATTVKRLMARKGVDMRGLGFYGLRRSFETIGAETGNQVAVDFIMGHVPAASDMGAIYRRHVAESALRQVTDHVRRWLFGSGDRRKRNAQK